MATIRQIATESAVSPGTVSRILNNDPSLSVTNETRERVKQVAKNLNYQLPKKSIKKSTAVDYPCDASF